MMENSEEDPYVVIVTRPCFLHSCISNSGSASLHPSAKETGVSIQRTLSVLILFISESLRSVKRAGGGICLINGIHVSFDKRCERTRGRAVSIIFMAVEEANVG